MPSNEAPNNLWMAFEMPETGETRVGDRLQGTDFEYWTVLGGIYDPESRPVETIVLKSIYDGVKYLSPDSDGRSMVHAASVVNYAIQLCNPELPFHKEIDTVIKKQVDRAVLDCSKYSQNQMLKLLPQLIPTLSPDRVPVLAALRSIFAAGSNEDGQMEEFAVHSRARRLSRAAIIRFAAHEKGLSTELSTTLKEYPVQ